MRVSLSMFRWLRRVCGFFLVKTRWLDERLAPFTILAASAYIVLASLLFAALITLVNFNYYNLGFEFCLDIECFKTFYKEFRVQIEVITVGGQVAIFIALVLGPYIALKSYISTTNAQVFGNNISHIGFFEKYIISELQRRERIRPSSLDFFSLYRLMFPRHGEVYASEDFLGAIRVVIKEIEYSNSKFKSIERKFEFPVHRERMIGALSCVFVRIDAVPRIDFLECEDEVLDLLKVLVRVFCRRQDQLIFPERNYR